MKLRGPQLTLWLSDPKRLQYSQSQRNMTAKTDDEIDERLI